MNTPIFFITLLMSLVLMFKLFYRSSKIIKFKGSKQTILSRLKFPFFAKSLKYKIRFNESCKYASHEFKDQFIVNRLFGLGKKEPKDRSTQFVWHYHPTRDSFLVDMLIYQDGKPHIQEVAELSVGQWVSLEVYQNTIKVNGVEYQIFQKNDKGCGCRFLPPKMFGKMSTDSIFIDARHLTL